MVRLLAFSFALPFAPRCSLSSVSNTWSPTVVVASDGQLADTGPPLCVGALRRWLAFGRAPQSNQRRASESMTATVGGTMDLPAAGIQ